MATIAEALAMAFAHHQRGEFAQAEQIYRKVLQAEPRHADAWHLLGLAEHQTGRNAEAVQSITRAISIDGGKALFHDHLGAVYAVQKDFERAETSFRRALALNDTEPQTHYNLAALLNLRGKPDEAMESYRQAIQRNPKFAEAHFNLGNLLRAAGRLQEAERSFADALAARTGYLKAIMSLAGVQFQQQKYDESEANWRRAIEIDPRNAEPYFRLGILLEARGKTEEAFQAYRTAVLQDPQHATAQNNLGCLYREREQFEQAEQCFRLAVAADPDSHLAWNNLGAHLQTKKKDYEAAAICFSRAIELQPDCAAAHHNLGGTRQQQKQFEAALSQYEKALSLDPSSPNTLTNIGTVYHMMGKVAEAIDYHRRALALDARHYGAYYGLGAALHLQGRGDEALKCYDEAIRIRPDYHEAYYYRSFVHLSRGDLAAGWPDYEARFRCLDFKQRHADRPRWDGSPLDGRTLLVHAEQGLGDTLQFIRYVPLVRKMGGTVIVEVQPALVPLLQASLFDVVPQNPGPPPFDLQIPMLSLPGVFGTSEETIPREVPYLAPDAQLDEKWRARLREIPGFKVGIAWQGNASYTFDHFRSVPLVEFAPLAEIAGVTLISLQKHGGVEQIAALQGRFTVLDLGSTLDQSGGAFMETAAVMRNLDLVITSDTATAHLAGGLGVQVWVALSGAPEWRWMRNRTDSPWYPTMRLFRQARLRDWTSVFAEMKIELDKLVGTRAAARLPSQQEH